MNQLDRIEKKLDQILQLLNVEKPETISDLLSEFEPKVIDPFEQFWECYPRKVGKKAARKAWDKHKLNRSVDKLISDVQTRLRSDHQWQDKRFIIHPSTYLNGEHWNDEITPTKREVRKERDIQQREESYQTFAEFDRLLQQERAERQGQRDLDSHDRYLRGALDKPVRINGEPSSRSLGARSIEAILGTGQLRAGVLCPKE